MWAGAYSLHLYCENYDPNNLGHHSWDEFPHQYIDELGTVCRAKARKAGWKINNDGTAYCPKCTGHVRPKVSTDGQ